MKGQGAEEVKREGQGKAKQEGRKGKGKETGKGREGKKRDDIKPPDFKNWICLWS